MAKKNPLQKSTLSLFLNQFLLFSRMSSFYEYDVKARKNLYFFRFNEDEDKKVSLPICCLLLLLRRQKDNNYKNSADDLFTKELLLLLLDKSLIQSFVWHRWLSIFTIIIRNCLWSSPDERWWNFYSYFIIVVTLVLLQISLSIFFYKKWNFHSHFSLRNSYFYENC